MGIFPTDILPQPHVAAVHGQHGAESGYLALESRRLLKGPVYQKPFQHRESTSRYGSRTMDSIQAHEDLYLIAPNDQTPSVSHDVLRVLWSSMIIINGVGSLIRVSCLQ